MTFEPFIKFNISFFKEIETIIILAEKMNLEKDISKQEQIIMQEAFLVKLAAEWEFYCLNILAYCISLNTSKLSNELHLSLPKKIGFNNSYAILNGVNFITIKGSDDLISKSKKYICEENNPFLKIDRNLLKQLDTVIILRNYIAHQSDNAKERLNKLYISKNLKFMKAGEYLLSFFENTDYSNSRKLFAGLATISTEIWKILDANSYNYIYGEYDALEKAMAKNPDSKEKFEALKNEFFKAIEKMKNVFEILEKQII